MPKTVTDVRRVQKAFVLGAGLGTRLKSLTEFLPKPLIPVYQRPLIAFAFEHLRSVGISEFIVNTHHCAEAYAEQFPDNAYRDCPVIFRHEPVLLETGGGIDNVSDLLAGDDFIVYNGDILTDLPLQPVLEAHESSGNLVTLVLRSDGHARHIALDRESGKVTDINDMLGTGNVTEFQFTGVYLCRSEFLDCLHKGEKHSVIKPFLEVIANSERIGGVVVDEGNWWDLGNRETYLEAHLGISGTEFPIYGDDGDDWRVHVHPSATVADDVEIGERTIIGREAVVESGASIHASLIWPGARVAAGAKLDHCIVRGGRVASGELAYENV